MSLTKEIRVNKNKSKLYFYSKAILLSLTGTIAIAYLSTSLYLLVRQRYLLFNPSSEISKLPSDRDFKLPYETVWLSVDNSRDRIHAWWVPASTSQDKPFKVLANEPAKVLKSPKTVLYFCGRAGNKSYANHIARLGAFRQLGFSVLVVDYRGFGQSEGDFPSESQIYQDSQIAWDYLVKTKKIARQDIFIYGESLGGAVAIDLAIKNPDAGGLIVQSSFTSIAEVVKQQKWLKLFPIDVIVTQRFDSIDKVRSLQVPVLFIHGTGDDVVPYQMSQQLYDAAPEPKQLLLIPKAGHFRIYQYGKYSYLKAIQKFVETKSGVNDSVEVESKRDRSQKDKISI